MLEGERCTWKVEGADKEEISERGGGASTRPNCFPRAYSRRRGSLEARLSSQLPFSPYPLYAAPRRAAVIIALRRGQKTRLRVETGPLASVLA